MQTICILGCGWLGLPLAENLIQAGYTVKGSTTSADKLSLLKRLGIQAHLIRLEPEPVGDDLADFLTADVVVLNVPPRAGKQGDHFHPQQMQAVATVLSQNPGRYVIYVSSTSVYPDFNREVTEEEVSQPAESAAPALVEAEQAILSLGNATVLRLGGLLGYERIPGRYVAGKQGLTTQYVPVNYIHRDDAVGLLRELLLRPQPGEVINGVAPLHPTRGDVYLKNCSDFGYVPPTFTEPAEIEPFKVISSKKQIATIPYDFRYPNPLRFFYQEKE